MTAVSSASYLPLQSTACRPGAAWEGGIKGSLNESCLSHRVEEQG